MIDASVLKKWPKFVLKLDMQHPFSCHFSFVQNCRTKKLKEENETIFVRLRSIGKSGSDIGYFNRTRNPKNAFYLREIRPQDGFQLRNPNQDFMDFALSVRLGNPKKDLQNCPHEQRSSFCQLCVSVQDRCS